MSATDSTDATASAGPAGRDGAGTSSRPSSVDADNPWLGLASFTEETRGYFFGRESEVAELTRRVQRKLLTVLFGKSGLGKTSILRAGLVPRLRSQGYFPVYLRIDYGHDGPEPAEQIKQAINRAARGLGVIPDMGASGGTTGAGGAAGPGGTGGEAGGKASAAGQWTQTDVAAPGESIWEFLHQRDDVLKGASAETLLPLLIFDQFEELFTLAQSDEFGRARAARFVEELADLVENRPPKALEAKLDSDDSITERFDFSRSDYRVVIALREDYLAPLESLRKQMPTLSQNRLRLAPMTGTQALQAVLEPGNRMRSGKPLVTEEVAEAIVRFVAGGSELANAEVEPSLLSLICRELNEQRITQGRSEISQDLLAGSHETILSNFYERSLADQPESVRRIIEDDLLTESGYRENLAEESLLKRFQAAGAAPDALAKLVNHRLLRIEERLDVRRVELTHDVLTGVVKASRDQRHERESREATERLLAEQRERENAARRALRRARAIAAGCTALAVVAIAAAIFAFVSFRQARRAELLARQTRAVSEQARQQSEGLLGFLTDDFVRELETFGRYQTIAELTQREIDYFQHLPRQLKDPETVRGGALALINHARALSFVGDAGTADKNATEAIALLEQLRRDGDGSDSTAVVLARAYMAWQSTVLDDTGGFTDLNRAIDLLRPIAGRAGSSAQARRAYLTALERLGDENSTQRHFEGGAQTEREAMRLATQLGARRLGDVTLDEQYVAAEDYLTIFLVALGRNEEAHRVAEDALGVVDQVLAQHPQYGTALNDKQDLARRLTAIATSELDPADAVRTAMQEAQTSLALIKIEPQNERYANRLGIAYADVSNSLWSAGRLHESIPYARKAEDAFGEASAGGAPVLVMNLAKVTGEMVGRQASLGDLAGVSASLAAGDAFMSRLRNRPPAGSVTEATVTSALRTGPTATLAYERDDFGTTRRIARSAMAQLRAIRPGAGFPTLEINSGLCVWSGLDGQAEYRLGAFAAAEQAERAALKTCFAFAGNSIAVHRGLAANATWLSMALAREGKRAEAAQTIAPVVTMYRALDKKNHGDQWLPLEFAEALYARALSDPAHRAALLREAAQRVDHLIPSIARLHDTREWRARIEVAEYPSRITASH